MAHEFYVTIEGTKQGKFKGETLRTVQHAKDKVAGLSFEYELVSPRDMATGLPSGKRQHKPIVITKEWGASSPQLFNACATNEILKKVSFDFIKTDKAGKEHIYYTIDLTNATISSYKPYTAEEEGAKHGEPNATFEMERIEFTFQKIELTNKDSNTTAQDDWLAN